MSRTVSLRIHDQHGEALPAVNVAVIYPTTEERKWVELVPDGGGWIDNVVLNTEDEFIDIRVERPLVKAENLTVELELTVRKRRDGTTVVEILDAEGNTVDEDMFFLDPKTMDIRISGSHILQNEMGQLVKLKMLYALQRTD